MMGSVVNTTSTSRYSRTASLPPSSTFTVAGWVKVTGSFADYRRAMRFGNTYASRYEMGFRSSGVFYIEDYDGTIINGSTSLSLDTWYYVAVACAGTGATDYVGRIWNSSGTLLDTVSGNGGASASANLYLIGSNSANSQLNGKAAYFRVWDVSLSQSELEAEQFSPTVVKTTDFNSGFIDSENGIDPQASRSWTVTGTITSDSDTPPVNLSDPIRLIWTM